MNRIFSLLCVAALSIALCAQDGFQFSTIKENPITSIKNQNRSGTCWSYSGLALLESELLRMGKGEHELAPMFVAHHTYQDRGVNYVRFYGEAPLGQGGSFYDVIYCLKRYGIAPQQIYKGIEYGDSLPNHNELELLMTATLKAIGNSKIKPLSPVWKNAYIGILDAYMGKIPETFQWQGKDYTPLSYAQSLGLKPDDYISLTSYTHHPFYTQFAIEVPDNWRNGLSYNLPIDEFMEVMDNAIMSGYTFAWGSDVSSSGFTRDGIGVVPDMKADGDLTGSDAARWIGLTEKERNQKRLTEPSPEIWATQEMRQNAYDSWDLTDDHGMLIYGIAKDQTGKDYYMVKNSWGEAGNYKGIWYASKSFVRHYTMNILVHKDAIPTAIRRKLNIK